MFVKKKFELCKNAFSKTLAHFEIECLAIHKAIYIDDTYNLQQFGRITRLNH